MPWRNSAERYGLIGILLHWSMALLVVGLFGLGLWMSGLDLFSPWYTQAPRLHQGLGVLLALLLLLRLFWRVLSPPPRPLASHGRGIRMAARISHGLLYAGLLGMVLSGYLLSSAEGRPVEVFGLFSLPALFAPWPGQRLLAGSLHQGLAWGLMGLALLHALAALKHHLIDRDATLRRILGGGS
ncbi:cytochrome b [Pseudomonas sp. NW5]|uniref:cytochrome b n=1 Tax=Pseudomonas sp. NW5 TaxID=2934934 RepID=UPI002021EE99|nr:cytochrome b [Pseudomonas sp. NW5]MCL7462194.1 cytochrome b [Pseudomonas sp. NW5]